MRREEYLLKQVGRITRQSRAALGVMLQEIAKRKGVSGTGAFICLRFRVECSAAAALLVGSDEKQKEKDLR